MNEELELIIAYKFKNIKLLEIALTHSSYSNELGLENYEKLEFLGDAVLELAITDLLYKTYPNETEGQLSKSRASIVSQAGLSIVAKELELGKYIKLGKGESRSKGNEKNSILSSSLEAIFGAIFIDGSYNYAHKTIKKCFKRIIDNAINSKYDMDYKTKLQEFVQTKYKKAPTYKLINKDGEPHNITFEVELDVIKFKVNAKSKNKKRAEQMAARKALDLFNNED